MKLESLISEIFSLNEDQIHDELELKAIESWDSMAHMELIASLEASYEIALSGDEIIDIKKIGDIKQVIIRHKGKL